jgi:hypothetical protein
MYSHNQNSLTYIKHFVAFLFMAICSISTVAQVTLGNGKHVLEISGAASTYYNHRMYKDGIDNFRKNRFRLRDAQIQLEGRVGRNFEYELQFDIADLASPEKDPENPGLMDAYVKYKGLKVVDITMGYTKLPYSRFSLTPFIYSPYWQRAELVRGDVFSRRDVGVTLSKSFYKQTITAYAGMYTGTGELLFGDNDATGRLEYVGRVEASWPARYRYRDVDDKISPKPIFFLGLNGRYTNRPLKPGRFFPAGAVGEYGIKTINGEKLTYGLDAAMQYMGFSAQFEMHQLKATPQNANDPLLKGLPLNQTEGFMKAGGYVVQANYFSKPLRSIFSARFEELNLNDLVPGIQRRLGAAYCFQIDGFNAMIKFQYFHVLEEEIGVDELNWTKQFRIGVQYLFK